MKPISLYLHIPFCVQRCGYCNFFSTTRTEQCGNYIAALGRAIATAPLDNREAVTLYFGGGTPSLLGEGLLTLLTAIRARLPIAADAEITLEANPATIDLPTLRKLREGGFNRISFGLQSDDDDSLRKLGRLHSAEQGRQSVALARQAGFTNISIDLMLGTPEQDMERAVALCKRAVELAPEHISAYLLKVEPDTPFGRKHMERFCADGDAAADLYLAACAVLEGSGYHHYEVSNFAKNGCESRHNNAYWKLTDYLGIGPSAYSFMDGRRFYFPSDLDAFTTAEDVWQSVVDDGTGGGVDEYVMLALRLAEGLSLPTLRQRYGIDTAPMEQRAALLQKQGLLVMTDERIILTDSGFLVSNSVINYLSEGI
ncbi:MAG: radical SAM family heme chaperone HemW [Angelakisella sp.]